MQKTTSRQPVARESEGIPLPCLAVLRGVCDGGGPGTYFGSTLSLGFWIDRARADGLITGNRDALRPTHCGEKFYHAALFCLPIGRSPFWNSPELTILLRQGKVCDQCLLNGVVV